MKYHQILLLLALIISIVLTMRIRTRQDDTNGTTTIQPYTCTTVNGTTADGLVEFNQTCSGSYSFSYP